MTVNLTTANELIARHGPASQSARKLSGASHTYPSTRVLPRATLSRQPNALGGSMSSKRT